jgi:hypothetical protein
MICGKPHSTVIERAGFYSRGLSHDIRRKSGVVQESIENKNRPSHNEVPILKPSRVRELLPLQTRTYRVKTGYRDPNAPAPPIHCILPQTPKPPSSRPTCSNPSENLSTPFDFVVRRGEPTDCHGDRAAGAAPWGCRTRRCRASRGSLDSTIWRGGRAFRALSCRRI